MNYSSLVPGIFVNIHECKIAPWINLNIINMNIHEPREITIQACKIICKIYHSYLPHKLLFHAFRLNMNNLETQMATSQDPLAWQRQLCKGQWKEQEWEEDRRRDGKIHQGMDGNGVWRFPEGSGRQGRMERYCCNVICGAPTTSKVKGLRWDERWTLNIHAAGIKGRYRVQTILIRVIHPNYLFHLTSSGF